MKRYFVQVEPTNSLSLFSQVEIYAESLEDAIEQGRENFLSEKLEGPAFVVLNEKTIWTAPNLKDPFVPCTDPERAAFVFDHARRFCEGCDEPNPPFWDDICTATGRPLPLIEETHCTAVNRYDRDPLD